MNKVYFTNNIDIILHNLEYSNTIVVYHEMYIRPLINGVTVIDWVTFRSSYMKYVYDSIVLVGLNRMITPSNRCDFIFDYLTTLTPHIPKIIVDSSPFIGEPWRVFFHYLFSKCNKFGDNYSYTVEGDWKKWYYYLQNDCKISPKNLSMFINNTYSDLDSLNTEFYFFECSNSDLDYYDELKNIVFNKYDTPKMLINNLLKLCNKHFNIDISPDSYLTNRKFVVPCLGVYKFMVEENIRRMGIYNCFTKGNIV
jgi:hypothetical protein